MGYFALAHEQSVFFSMFGGKKTEKFSPKVRGAYVCHGVQIIIDIQPSTCQMLAGNTITDSIYIFFG